MIIEFYVFNTSDSQQAWLLTCDLIEKQYQNQRQTYVLTETLADAKKLDQLLWQFKNDSFIPHGCVDPSAMQQPPILIGHKGLTTDHPRETLINLSHSIPVQYQQVKHLIEIVYTDPSVQQLARERYKHYRAQQHEITTIKQ